MELFYGYAVSVIWKFTECGYFVVRSSIIHNKPFGQIVSAIFQLKKLAIVSLETK